MQKHPHRYTHNNGGPNNQEPSQIDITIIITIIKRLIQLKDITIPNLYGFYSTKIDEAMKPCPNTETR